MVEHVPIHSFTHSLHRDTSDGAWAKVVYSPKRNSLTNIGTFAHGQEDHRVSGINSCPPLHRPTVAAAWSDDEVSGNTGYRDNAPLAELFFYGTRRTFIHQTSE